LQVRRFQVTHLHSEAAAFIATTTGQGDCCAGSGLAFGHDHIDFQYFARSLRGKIQAPHLVGSHARQEELRRIQIPARHIAQVIRIRRVHHRHQSWSESGLCMKAPFVIGDHLYGARTRGQEAEFEVRQRLACLRIQHLTTDRDQRIGRRGFDTYIASDRLGPAGCDRQLRALGGISLLCGSGLNRLRDSGTRG